MLLLSGVERRLRRWCVCMAVPTLVALWHLRGTAAAGCCEGATLAPSCRCSAGSSNQSEQLAQPSLLRSASTTPQPGCRSLPLLTFFRDSSPAGCWLVASVPPGHCRAAASGSYATSAAEHASRLRC